MQVVKQRTLLIAWLNRIHTNTTTFILARLVIHFSLFTRMSGDGEEMGIPVRYVETTQQIYYDLVVKNVMATGLLDIICACREPRNFDDLPSWIPDWSTDGQVPGICINQRYGGGDDFPGSPSIRVEKYHPAGIHLQQSGHISQSFLPITPRFLLRQPLHLTYGIPNLVHISPH